MRVAARRKLPVPEFLDEEHRRVVEEMREKSGRDFDDAYATRIRNNQPKAIMLFQRGQRIKDPEISALASRGLSMIESWARKTSSLFEEMNPESEAKTKKRLRFGGAVIRAELPAMGIPRAELPIDEAKVRELLAAQHPDLAQATLSAVPCRMGQCGVSTRRTSRAAPAPPCAGGCVGIE